MEEDERVSDYSGFLIRSNLEDTGYIPRSGNWTGCPDILIGGKNALGKDALIANYNKSYDELPAEYFDNNFYVRAKNTTTQDLTKNVYLFQVPQSLFLTPNIWYNPNNLLTFKQVSPDGIVTEQNFQTITAPAAGIAATNAFTWRPTTTEHHCLVTVVADNFDAVEEQFPRNINNDVNAYGQWIYANGNIGWHNVNIQATTASDIYEHQMEFRQIFQDGTYCPGVTVKNAPVGAEIGFSANHLTAAGDTVALGATIVPVKPGYKDPNINPSFVASTYVDIEQDYRSNVSFYIDLKGKPMPENFHISFGVTAACNYKVDEIADNVNLFTGNSMYGSYLRSNFDEQSVFVNGRTREAYTGFEGFLRAFDVRVIPTFVTTIGSISVTPQTGFQTYK
jgi:hypothetical protein